MKDCAKLVPNSGVGPMFAENISRVDLTSNEVEVDHSRSNCFEYLVEGEHDMALGDLGVRSGGTTNNRIVVTKQVAVIIDWDTRVLQGGL